MQRRLVFTIGLVVCVMLLCQTAAHASKSPIDKGSYIVGGMAMVTGMSGDVYENVDGDGIKMLMLAPSLSGFVSHGVAFGGQLLVANVSQSGNSLTAFGIGPRLAYYFGDFKENEKVRGKSIPYLAVSYIYGKITNDWGVMDKSEYKLNAINFGGGIDYMLTNSIALVAQVDYRSDSISDKSDNSADGHAFDVMLGFSMFVW